MVTITLQFANSEGREIESALRKKYEEGEETSLIALCEKAILREADVRCQWIDQYTPLTPKYKPFSEQVRECTKSGNLVHENCHNCNYTLLMCKKYGGQCISSKCKDERIGMITGTKKEEIAEAIDLRIKNGPNRVSTEYSDDVLDLLEGNY